MRGYFTHAHQYSYLLFFLNFLLCPFLTFWSEPSSEQDMGIFITACSAAGLPAWNNIDGFDSHRAKDWLPAEKPGFRDNPAPVWAEGGSLWEQSLSKLHFIKANLRENDWRTHKHVGRLRVTQRSRVCASEMFAHVTYCFLVSFSGCQCLILGFKLGLDVVSPSDHSLEQTSKEFILMLVEGGLVPPDR